MLSPIGPQEFDVELLDTIKLAFGLKNDSAIANLFGLTRVAVHNIRFKATRLGLHPRLVIMSRIGFLGRDDWTIRVEQPYLSSSIASKISALRDVREGLPAPKFIDQVKLLFDCKRDAALAATLDIAPTTLAMIRSGPNQFGLPARLKILNRTEPFDLARFENMLVSSETLVEAVLHWMTQQERPQPQVPAQNSMLMLAATA